MTLQSTLTPSGWSVDEPIPPPSQAIQQLVAQEVAAAVPAAVAPAVAAAVPAAVQPVVDTAVAAAVPGAAATAAATAASTAAAAAAANLLSNAAPMPEATSAAAGAGTKASRETHQHERLTSSHGDQTLNASGVLAIVYTRSFDRAPTVIPTAETPAAGTLRPTLTYQHVKTGALWTGCIVTGTRPGPVTVGLLNTAVVMTTVPAAGAKFSLVALQSSLAA